MNKLRCIFYTLLLIIILPFYFIKQLIIGFYRNHIESSWITIDHFLNDHIVKELNKYPYINKYKFKYMPLPIKRNTIKVFIYVNENQYLSEVLIGNDLLKDLENKLNKDKSYHYIGKIKLIINYMNDMEE